MFRALSILSLLTVAACAVSEAPDGPADGPEDAFVGGKTDDLQPDEAAAVLALANSASFETLDDDVSLDVRAAAHIAEHRDGADGELGTGDDDLFETLEELDAVKWVGPRAFAKLLAYAALSGDEPCLLISEYVEKWGNYNKAIELYNCGVAPLDLAQVEICLVRNDDGDCSLRSDVGSALLPAGEVTTVCRRKSYHPAGLDPAPPLAERCDLERPGVMTFDGDDRLMLLRASDGAVFDALGRFDYRPPPSTWADVILRRCELTPADGISYYDHLDYFTEIESFDYFDFGVAPVAGCAF